MQFRITTGTGAPIYRQVTDQVRRAVASGSLEVGESLPSVRQLAKELVVNPNTISKAYSELVRDGVLESVPGKGFFVAKKRAIFTQAERWRRIDEAIDMLISEALTLDVPPEQVHDRLAARFLKWTSAKR